MKQLNKLQSILFALGGCLMVVGAGSFCMMYQQTIAAILFAVGAMLFGVMQGMQTYDGRNLTIRRLKSIMNLADLAFVVAGILMIDTALTNAYALNSFSGTLLLRPLFRNQENYIQFVYNKWLPAMLIGAILEVYSMHRISALLKKEDAQKPSNSPENP